MRTERVVLRSAIVCGIVLLLAPLTPRTAWVGLAINEAGGGGGGMRHAASWEWVALLCGLVGVLALVFGRWARPAVVAPAAGAAAAAAAFLIAAVAAGGHWRDAVAGSLDTRGYVTSPAPAAPFFAAVAAFGAALGLVLALGWFRRPEGDGMRR
jgi:hypothetical protein